MEIIHEGNFNGGLSNSLNEVFFHTVQVDHYYPETFWFSVGDLNSFSSNIIIAEREDFIFEFKDELMEIFSKIFSNFSPHELVDSTLRENGNTNFKKYAEELGLNRIESVFLMFLMIEKDISKGTIFSEDYADIVRSHAKEYNNTVFDTIDKVQAALLPSKARLGFENFQILKKSNIGVSESTLLMSDRNLFNIFMKFACALGEKDVSKEMLVKDITLKINVDSNLPEMSTNRIVKSNVNSFFKMPIESPIFLKWLLNQYVSDVEEIDWEYVPRNLTDEETISLLNYEILTCRENSSLNIMKSANDVWVNITESLYSLRLEPKAFSTLFGSVSELSFYKEGYRRIAPEAFAYAKVKSTYEFHRLNIVLGAKNFGEDGSQKWINEYFSADYVLSKMYERWGLSKTIQAITRVMDDEEICFNTAQWLWVIENYGDVEDSPLTWWIAMAGCGDDE